MDQLLEEPDLVECFREAKAQAQLLPNGRLRDALLEKARRYEALISTNASLETKSSWRPKQAP
jgi:hypothetical protein